MREKNPQIKCGVFVGIDVSKDTLDIHFAGKDYHIFNTKNDIIDFIETELKTIEIVLCVLEHTGGYERVLLQALLERKIAVHRSHPMRVHAFAKACNHFAKTDKLDALLLSRYASFVSKEETGDRAKSAEYEEIKELRRLVKSIEEDLHAAQCRLKQYPENCRVFLEEQIIFCKKQIGEISQKIQEIIARSEELKTKTEVMQSMPGVGQKTAAMIIAELPELGSLNKKQIACLAGLAPKTSESGKKAKRAHIYGGRFYARKALYMCALVAARHCPKMKEIYQGMISKGKPKKVALVAIMRRMLVWLNAMIKNNTTFSLNFT